MFEDWIAVHVALLAVLGTRLTCSLLQLLLLLILEYGVVDFLEAAKRINWTTFSLRSLEEILGSWVQSLVGVLSWSSSASSASWRVSLLSVWALGVLLLHMCIKSGIREIGLIAIFAFEVSSSVVVFGSSLSTLLTLIGIILFTAVFRTFWI